MRLIVLFACTMLLSLTVMAQDGFRKQFIEGNQLMEEKFYSRALGVWLMLEKEQPDNANVKYKIGLCYLKSSNEKAKSLDYLEGIGDNISKNYDPFNHLEDKAPREAIFYLGQAYHLNYMLDKAIAQFGKFKSAVKKNHDLYAEADRYTMMCNNAKELMASPVSLKITNLGCDVNSDAPDFSPVISVDERQMFFTTRRVRSDSSNLYVFDDGDGMHYEDIYIVYKDDEGNWGKPEAMHFNSDGHEATINVSVDGQTLYVYKDDGGDGNIYESVLEGDMWTFPSKMGDKINTESWETHGTISADGKFLYFVSDRKGGFGGRDIYRCKRIDLAGGLWEWSDAMNLGPTINTPYDEDAPYLHPDGKTLYFASNGHKTMGGFDLFRSYTEDNLKWTAPVNIGYPVNTVDDDAFYVESADGKRAYYSSRKEGGCGEADIYLIEYSDPSAEFNLAVLKGVINVPDGQSIPATTQIVIRNPAMPDDSTVHIPRQRDGVFVAILEPCQDYELEYKVDGKTFHKDKITIPCKAYSDIEKELFLDPLNLNESGQVVNMADNAELMWQLLLNDEPYTKAAGTIVTYLNDAGKIVFVEAVDDKGMFKFHDLPLDKKQLLDVKLDEPSLCDKIEVALIGENGKILGKALRQGDCKFLFGQDGPRWQVLYNKKPYEKEGTIVTYLDKDGNTLITEKLDNNGIFTYYELPKDIGYIFNIQTDDPALCDKMEVVLLGANGSGIIGRAVRDKRCKYHYNLPIANTTDTTNNTNTNTNSNTTEDPKFDATDEVTTKSSFDKYYTYNNRGVNTKEQRFVSFINDVLYIIKQRGSVNIVIESSASKVPTRSYKNNKTLAKNRSGDAKSILLSQLSKKGIKADKVNFIAINSLVQGPAYKGDYIENRETYERYQYIKMIAK